MARSTMLIQGITSAEHARLIKAYLAPERHYHSLEHINKVLQHLATFKLEAKETEAEFPVDWLAVERAVWFHDAVYDGKLPAGENEKRSAQWAEEAGPEIAQQVNQGLVTKIILATAKCLADQDFRQEATVEANSIKVMLDSDVAGLGQDYELFKADTGQIRLEYPEATDEQFEDGRVKFMQAMLARKRIYYTDYFFDKCEAKARENLQRAVLSLTHDHQTRKASITPVK